MQKRNGVVLVIDLGTQSLRGTVMDACGTRLRQWSFPVATERDGARCEQSPQEWRGRVWELLRAVADEPELAARLVGVAACGTLAGAVCVSREGEPLRPAILYSDRRAAAVVEEVEHCVTFRRLVERTGWRCYGGDLLPQALYLKRSEVSNYDRAARILDSTGYLNYVLTGEASMDAYTRLSCYGDPEVGNEMPAELLAELGLDAGKFGTPRKVGSVIGLLRAKFGLPMCPVFSIPYDSATAYLSAALDTLGAALDISGTVTSFGVLHHRQVVDRERRIYSVPYGDGGQWLVRGSTAMSGGVVEWARATLVRGTHDDLDAMLRTSPPGAGGVLFLPYLAGERAPLWNPHACGVFFGLSAATGLADMVRAVVEGLCFSLRHIESVIEECGVEIGEVSLAGGLSRNPLMNQIKADITGKTLRPAADFELTTLGAVAIAGCALGWFGSMGEAKVTLGGKGDYVRPEPLLGNLYRDRFACYVELTSQLFPLFRE